MYDRPLPEELMEMQQLLLMMLDGVSVSPRKDKINSQTSHHMMSVYFRLDHDDLFTFSRFFFQG